MALLLHRYEHTAHQLPNRFDGNYVVKTDHQIAC